jgi:hypothetical protein
MDLRLPKLLARPRLLRLATPATPPVVPGRACAAEVAKGEGEVLPGPHPVAALAGNPGTGRRAPRLWAQVPQRRLVRRRLFRGLRGQRRRWDRVPRRLAPHPGQRPKPLLLRNHVTTGRPPLIPAQPRALLDCLQPMAEVCPLPPLEGETTEILGEAAPTQEHRGRRARGKSRPRTAGATEEARRANASLARPQRKTRALVAAAKA